MPDVPLEPGMSRQHEFVAEGDLLTDVGGTLGVPVLSTPGMIGVMEKNATALAREHLADGKGTVGFEVCIKHVGGAPEGSRCTVHARRHPGGRPHAGTSRRTASPRSAPPTARASTRW